MSDELKAKLDGILANFMVYVLNNLKPNAIWVEGTAENAIAQIDRAYHDDGYIHLPITVRDLRRANNLMSGAEWYERFEKHFEQLAIHSTDIPNCVQEKGVHIAAKRAAGLDNGK